MKRGSPYTPEIYRQRYFTARESPKNYPWKHINKGAAEAAPVASSSVVPLL